jgi:hypothetical protein
MKKKLILLIIFIWTCFTLDGKVVPLPDLMKPESIQLDDNQFYISEGTSIYIYNFDNFKLVKKIGKEGEGPEEFKTLPFLPLFVNITDKHIVVNSFGKISRFDKKGKFLSEEKVKGGYIFYIMPLGQYLVGQGGVQENKNRYRTINIYDKKLNKLKEVCRVMDDFKGPGRGYDVLEKRFRHQVMENHIFISKEKQFVINIYDLEGKKTSAIKVDYKLVPMTQKDRENITGYLKNSNRTKAFFPLFKPLRFPDYYPAIMNLYSADQKMYIMTWKRKNQETEFFVFNEQGKMLKKFFLPLAFQNAIDPFPFAIKNNKFYQLVENEENEEWELHINEIK